MPTTESKSKPRLATRLFVTWTLVAIAIVVAAIAYWRFVEYPWTRDGMVKADVVNIAPEVMGKVIEVFVEDNQLVSEGDVLFTIDPRTFELAVEQGRVALEQAGVQIDQAKAAVRAQEAEVQESISERDRAQKLAEQQAGSVQEAQRKAAAVEAMAAGLDAAQADLRGAEAGLAGAAASLAEAELKLEKTRLYAPADGYAINVNVDPGDFAFPGIPMLAFIDLATFHVEAYFKETQLRHMAAGDRVTVTLMSHPDEPLDGTIESIGRAISPPDIATTEGVDGLVPQVEPTFDWIRLAQRVPVRVRLEYVPDDIELISGTTASVSVQPGSSD
jgi:multidrug resistance efflux pump